MACASIQLIVKPEKSEIFVNEALPLTVLLLFDNENIAGVGESEALHLEEGEFADVVSLPMSQRIDKYKHKGKVYNSYPISRHLISFDKEGTYHLSGAVFDVDVAEIVDGRVDFFGRPFVRHRREKVVAPECKIKVKKLPSEPGKTDFSGAVGDFKIDMEIPPGDIVVGEEGIAVITIEGRGFLPKTAMADYSNAFLEGVKLKSVSESRDAYLDNGTYVSRLRLECSFIPEKQGSIVIGEVKFNFFHPASGKYVSAGSAPVEMEVKSSLIRRELIEI